MAPASETELRVASILYYQLFEREFPDHGYTNQDIQYIIEKLGQYRDTNVDDFRSEIIH